MFRVNLRTRLHCVVRVVRVGDLEACVEHVQVILHRGSHRVAVGHTHCANPARVHTRYVALNIRPSVPILEFKEKRGLELGVGQVEHAVDVGRTVDLNHKVDLVPARRFCRNGIQIIVDANFEECSVGGVVLNQSGYRTRNVRALLHTEHHVHLVFRPCKHVRN